MFMIPANRPFYVPIDKIDLYTGMREDQFTFSAEGVPEAIRRQSIASLEVNKPKKWYDYPKNFVSGLF
jgi:amino acid transporter